MAYKVEIPDGSWHSTDDLTGKELEAIQAATDTPWSVLNPFRDIAVYRAYVAAFAIRLLDMSDDALKEWFEGRSHRELEAGLKVDDSDGDLPGAFEDGVPLVEADEPSTTSSASSPNPPSAGPQT